MKNARVTTHQGFGHLIRKAALVTLVAICAILGVIGLVLPIIPGVLFLFLGAWFLAKLSSRFAGHFNENSLVRKWKNRGAGFSQLNTAEKLKLSVLYTAKSAVDTLEGLWQRLMGSEKA